MKSSYILVRGSMIPKKKELKGLLNDNAKEPEIWT
jgi:hypothetical protein